MAVEKIDGLVLQHAHLCLGHVAPGDPNHFRDWRWHERLDPIETLNYARLTPPLEELPPFLQRSDATQTLPEFIRIENRRSVAVRVEMNEGVFLVEIELFSQPVKGAGVIVLYVYGKGDRRRGSPPDGGGKKGQGRPVPSHRAPLICGFLASFARNSTREMEVSPALVPR